MALTILIIDDDAKLNRLLSDYLADFGFETICATHPEHGLEQLQRKAPDLVILDVMLPGINGFEVCKQIRKTQSVPIIMLTARGDITDRVTGLELGADDYLPKPFEPRELVARVQSVLRRSVTDSISAVHRFGTLVIDYPKQQVTLAGKRILLTANEFAVLALLSKQPGKVFHRDQILNELRGFDWEAFNRSVDITVSRLRQKLGDDPKSSRFIKTIWGSGYSFIGSEDHA